jgi:alpha-amylase
MAKVCFYFQVHQPLRIKKFSVFHIGEGHDYFHEAPDDTLNNRIILEKVADKCYLKTNKILLDLLKKYPEMRISFSFSGILLEQLQKNHPEVLKSFQQLVKTGQVEILAETYYHSLAFIFSKDEFICQVEMHQRLIKELFGVKPKVFRNTELIYNNDLAKLIEEMGFNGILAEGADHILLGKSPNKVQKAKGTRNLKVLLKNYRLSDDIAFRFSDPSWAEYPLSAKRFAEWISEHQNDDVVNLFMDFETFGEHQWEESGIFDFLSDLPAELISNSHGLVTPSESILISSDQDIIDVPEFVSWADEERDLSAWMSNTLQQEALKNIYGLEESVLKTKDDNLIADWRRLQTSDHFYYMCTKYFNDGNVHKYFNPYDTPYEAFINYMNALQDLQLRIEKHQINKSDKSKTKAKKNRSK